MFTSLETRVIDLPCHKTSSSWVHLFKHSAGMWQTERQTTDTTQ